MAMVAIRGVAKDGKEVNWKMIPCSNNTTYIDLGFYNGFFYLVTCYGALDVVDTVSLETNTSLPFPPKKNLPRRLSCNFHDQYLDVICICEYTICVDGGELLMLCSMPFPSHCPTPITIYRANFEVERWEILQSLRGQAILLSPLSCLFSVRPKKLLYGLKEDYLYILGGD